VDFGRRLPVPLLCLLFVLLGLFVVFGSDAYGRTWDEGLQNWYGQSVYEWYRSGGSNIGFIRDSNPREYMPQHGPFAEVVIAAAQDLTGEQWRTRSMAGGVMGVLGIAAIALCGNEIAGRWGALLAAVGLTLYPRYTGAIFNNSKDVPFTAAMTFVLWATLRLARRWERGHRVADGAVLGLCLGIAASIRVSAVIWYGVLAVAAGWWLWHRRGGWVGVARCALAVCGVSYLTMLALWPYVFLNPVTGIVESIRAMAAYDWVGPIMFGGEPVRATELPWNYAPQWLVVGSPPLTVALALAGAGFVVADLARGRTPVAELLAGALAIVPVGAIIVLNSTVYNGLRHFLFAVPGMVLLAVVGVLRLARGRRVLVGVLVMGLLAGQAEVVLASGRLHPLEYMYFSPVAGGYRTAVGRYETDYWRACETIAMRWLARLPPTPAGATVGGVLAGTAQAEMPPGFRSAEQDPDFFVESEHAKPPSGYTRVHEVVVEGTVVCTLHAR
jgi:4-amino-4-deoxy-L-arabinose transferase-like glycosyltransferase